MSSIPLLNDNQDEIRQSLSIQEIHIALTFLKKRFRSYSVKEIVQALNDYVVHKQACSIGIPISQRSSMAISHVRQGLFLSHRSRPQIQEDRITKSEEIKLVAKLYTESGINYSLAQFFYPTMSQKDYKTNLQLIAAQTLNSIEKYLSYECNIQVEQLSTAQKRSVRQRLVNLRQWMGKTNPQEMKTYMLFIERFYLNESIEIQYKQAIELYKLILQSVKGPQVELANQSHTNRGLRQQLTITNENQQRSLSKEEENALILLFKQLCSVQKVSDAMCQKYGYNIKWSIHSVKNILKRTYKASLKKLAQTTNLYLKKTVNLWFGYGDEDVAALLQYENSLQTKIALLDFYTLKKITQLKLRQFVKKVNQFYLRQYQRQGVIHQTLPEECVSIPTLIIEEKPIQVVDLIDMQMASKKEQSKIQLQRRERIIMRKKKHWSQVVLLDQSLQEDQIFLFPRKINKKDKQANDNTDIEDQQPRRNREKQIFKPKKSVEKNDQVKEKVVGIEKNDNKDNQTKQEQQISQKEQRVQKPQIEKQPQMLKLTKKRQKINSSFDSIESEPVRLSFYNKFEKSQKKRSDSKLKTRFKRKEIHTDSDKMELQN